MKISSVVTALLVAIGVTGCNDHSKSPDVEYLDLNKTELNAIDTLITGVNKDYDWPISASSEDKADSNSKYTTVKFSATKPFTSDTVEGEFSQEIHKIFTYNWQELKKNAAGEYEDIASKPHQINIGVPGLATTQDKLQDLLNSDQLSREDIIKQAVWSHFALPMALGNNQIGAYTSFDALTNEPVVANGNKPLCKYTVNTNQAPRSDFSMRCSIPASISPFNSLTSVTLEQVYNNGQSPQQAAKYYTTSRGTNYEAYHFIQVIEPENAEIPSADILIHPGIGIISIELTNIKLSQSYSIQATQTKWQWFNNNPNILDQDN
ncbi:hypothetical protein [Vibrio gallicus]|uniref:hypothetical protein n=1 Tax=Vibrio gallicus TaxID=190897 RepID=UPI0021C3E98B|nr:hypothetical protein [Vibrio gallicus]